MTIYDNINKRAQALYEISCNLIRKRVPEEDKHMENTVNIFLFGKKYTVPDHLTIMTAMEYAGYQLVRGCGCRNGFCGACATIYRIKGQPCLPD